MKHLFLQIGVLLLAWALLVFRLSDRSLWIDEYLSLQMTRGSTTAVIAAAAADIHPPLYFLGLSAWTWLAGASDFSLRLFSAASALPAVALMLPLARRWLGPSASLPAALLLALAPIFVEASRMARYYALLTTLGLLATLLLLRALRQGAWSAWLRYALAGAALVSTLYPAAALLAAHGLAAALWPGRPARRARLWRWLGACSLVAVSGAVLYGPTLLVRLAEMRQSGGADLARSGLGLALGLAMTGYTFSVGETIFPWSAAAWLGLAAVAALVIAAAATRRPAVWLALAVLAASAVATALVTTFVSVNTPFLNVPIRVLYALPFFLLVLAAGWVALHRRWLRFAAVGGLCLVWGVGLSNIYRGQQYLNPIYLTPARDAARHLAQAADPAALVLLETDSVVGYYLAQLPAAPQQMPTDDPAAVALALAGRPRQVWLVTLGRDRTQAFSTADEIRALLAPDYALTATERLLPLDPTYVYYKTLLLRRETYTNRLTLETYQRRAP
jgi:4-amino-4-deoxy-L-arabinose transferase-like glycosyltransferase